MSAEDRRRVLVLSDDHTFRRKDALIQPFCQGRVVNGWDAIGYALFTSAASSSADLVPAPGNDTEYVARYRSFLDALWLAAMTQNRDRLDFISA